MTVTYSVIVGVNKGRLFFLRSTRLIQTQKLYGPMLRCKPCLHGVPKLKHDERPKKCPIGAKLYMSFILFINIKSKIK